MLFFSIKAKKWEIYPSALVLAVLFLGPTIYPDFFWQVPTLPYLVPVAVTLFLVLIFRQARPELRWIRRGEIDFVSWLLIAATSLMASVALLLWAAWTDNLGAGAELVKELKDIPLWFLLFVGIPGFALVNALAGEAVYRGFLQESLEARLGGRTSLILTLQASAFAAAHFWTGFPNGKIGYVMMFTYALMLGFLRMRTNGILAPFLTHLMADLVIGYTLILLAR